MPSSNAAAATAAACRHHRPTETLDERNISASGKMARYFIDTNIDSIQWTPFCDVTRDSRPRGKFRIRSNSSSEKSLRMEWGKMLLMMMMMMILLRIVKLGNRNDESTIVCVSISLSLPHSLARSLTLSFLCCVNCSLQFNVFIVLLLCCWAFFPPSIDGGFLLVFYACVKWWCRKTKSYK